MYNYCVLKIWVDFFSIGFGYGRKYDLKKKKNTLTKVEDTS